MALPVPIPEEAKRMRQLLVSQPTPRPTPEQVADRRRLESELAAQRARRVRTPPRRLASFLRDRAGNGSELAQRSRRYEPALALTDVLAAGLNRLPAAVTVRIFGSMLKGIDFVATNVPGIPIPVYLAGAEVVREYAFAPPSGSAVSFALVSHRDTCCIGVNVDTTAVPDPARLVGCLSDAFDEILELAPGEAASELLVPTG